MGSAEEPGRSFVFSFGLEKLGLVALRAPYVVAVLVVIATVLGAMGVTKLQVDDSLSELFRTNTEEFHRYEEIDRRFPSSEYDVLVVVEGKDLLKKPQLEAFGRPIVDLQLVDGVDGLVSMLSARGKPDANGYAAPLVPDDLPDGAGLRCDHQAPCATNEIVKGKFLSDDGELALAVIALDRKAVRRSERARRHRRHQQDGPNDVAPAGLTVAADRRAGHAARDPQRGGARPDPLQRPRPAVRRAIAVIFFRRVSLMLVAALPPVLAVLWSLGLLGWIGFKLNLFLNVMTPLIMVMGFADSMQMVSAIRIRLREGDTRLPGRALRRAGGGTGLRAGARHRAVVVLRAAVLAFRPDPHLRHGGRAGALHLVHCRDPGAADPRRLLDPQRGQARQGPPLDGPAHGWARRARRLDRRPRGAPARPLRPRVGVRAVCGLHGGLSAARAALPSRRPGARSRAGARCDGPHRPEAHRRQPRARHDRVERRHAALLARAARGHRQGARDRWKRRPGSATSGRWRACGAGCTRPATTASRRCRSSSASCPSISCAASSPRRRTRCW